MEIYLQPQDDNLLMRPAGKWAVVKLDYLARYINVFETSMRRKWAVRNYIDLLAGPGKNCIRDTTQVLLGSPLLALTTEHPFTGYFFVDLEQDNTQALQQRCAASPECHRVNIRTGDCNLLVDEIIIHLEREQRRSLNLAFLDPEGLELRWETVAKLASVRRMDLIINYPEGGLNRTMRQAFETDGQTLVDSFFGDRGWRKVYAEWRDKAGFHRRLIDFYKARLEKLGYEEVLHGGEPGDEPLVRSQRKRAPLYRLLFASKNRLGHEFWTKVTRRDAYGQARLL